jgi:hypothetical protein
MGTLRCSFFLMSLAGLIERNEVQTKVGFPTVDISVFQTPKPHPGLENAHSQESKDK